MVWNVLMGHGGGESGHGDTPLQMTDLMLWFRTSPLFFFSFSLIKSFWSLPSLQFSQFSHNCVPDMAKLLLIQSHEDPLCADTFGMSRQLGAPLTSPFTIVRIIHKLSPKPTAHCTSVSIQLHPDPKSAPFKPLDGQGCTRGWPHPSLLPGSLAAGGARSVPPWVSAGEAAPTAFNNHSFSTERCRK